MPDVSRWLYFWTDWFTFPTKIEVTSHRPECVHPARDQSVNPRHRNTDRMVRSTTNTYINCVSNMRNPCVSPGDTYHKDCVFQAHSQNCEKRQLASLCLCVCPSISLSTRCISTLTGRNFIIKLIIEGF